MFLTPQRAVVWAALFGAFLWVGGGAMASDYGLPGPEATMVTPLARCTVYHPADLGPKGTPHPVILWGNGTASRPDDYATGLHHWASWGFIVAAANTTMAGEGTEMLACLDALERAHRRFASPFFMRVDSAHVGTSGHSQGGGGSIMAATDPRIGTSAPMEPYITGLGHDSASWDAQQGPMFLISGGLDTTAPADTQQQPIYDAVSVPVFWGTLEPADHLEPMGDFGRMAGPSTAWFLWQLAADDEASALFVGTDCELCVDPDWSVSKRDID